MNQPRSSAESEEGEPLPPRELRERGHETPEADAVEQHQSPSDGSVDADRADVAAVDASEADVVEQRMELEDDDERRDE
jgi:hypothetical protein